MPPEAHRLRPRSIVARTTASIALLAVLVGLVAGAGAAWHGQRHERARLERSLEELVSTVEHTAAIACYLRDRTLGAEIAQGLLRNRIVAGVELRTTDGVLWARAPVAAAGDAPPRRITRAIASPFDAAAEVGSLTLYVSDRELRAQTLAYAASTAWLLALQVLAVALGVGWVVYWRVTRPIKGISDELHALALPAAAELRVPPGNERDEIGRLVLDVNALIARLTTLLEAERELRREREVGERRMRLIVDRSRTGIFVVDAEGVLRSWNPAFATLLRLPPYLTAAAGTRLPDLVPGAGETLAGLLRDADAATAPRETDVELRAIEGGSAWLEIAVNPLGGGQLGGVVNDVTERRRAEASARRLAARDPLTGLLNRRGLDAELDRLAGHEGRGVPLAVLQIDLDRFKQVNDTLGHAAGDRVLRHVAGTIEQAVRRSDLAARPGGDEFVVVLVGIEDRARVEALAHGLCATLAEPIDLGGETIARIGASIGIAFADGRRSPAELLREADAAMYAVKQAGRGGIRLATSAAA